MSAQRGPSFPHRLRWESGTAAAHKRCDGFYCFRAIKTCNSAPRILQELKLTSTASFFNFPLLCPSLLPPCYFSSVVRNDLNFSTTFLFLSLSRVGHIYLFPPFLWEKIQAGAVKLPPLCSSVWCMFTRACENEKGLGMIPPNLTNWKWMQREHVAIGC